jgi:hypothetical protein
LALTDPPEIVSVPKDYTSFIHLEICLEGVGSVSIDRFSEPLVGLWQGFDDHVREPNPGGDETLRVSDIDVQPADGQSVGRGGDPKVDVQASGEIRSDHTVNRPGAAVVVLELQRACPAGVESDGYTAGYPVRIG